MKKEVMEKGVRWLYASRAVMGILGSVLVLELLSGLGVTGVCVMIGEKAEEALPYGYFIVYVFWMLYFTLVSYVLQEKRSDLIKKDLVEVVSGLCVAGGLFFVGESYGREWMRETFELRWSTLTCMMLLLYFALATALNAWAFYRCKSRTIKSEGRKGEKMLHAAAFVSMALFVPFMVVTGWFIIQLVPFLGGECSGMGEGYPRRSVTPLGVGACFRDSRRRTTNFMRCVAYKDAETRDGIHIRGAAPHLHGAARVDLMSSCFLRREYSGMEWRSPH